MIRIICSNTDFADAANVGGPVQVTYKTFDVDLPQVEAWLDEECRWRSRSFVGIERPAPALAHHPEEGR